MIPTEAAPYGIFNTVKIEGFDAGDDVLIGGDPSDDGFIVKPGRYTVGSVDPVSRTFHILHGEVAGNTAVEFSRIIEVIKKENMK